MDRESWPALPYEAWKDTCATLQLWTQVIGKVRLALMPWLHHTWQVTLYPTACGLTTGRMPHGDRALDAEFDFVAHALRLRTDVGERRDIALAPMPVSRFYAAVMDALAGLQVPVAIRTMPNEIPDAIPFDRDDVHRSYDADYANRCWRILCSATDVLQRFRARFYGKSSPVHFFWGSFDLAATRFSGRTAPPHPGGVPNLPDRVVRDAYSHEVSSAGFWPGGEAFPQPMFYSYAYPEPAGFADARIEPDEARYDTTLHEFVLPYDAVRSAADPAKRLTAFLQSSYVAAADLGKWNRAALEVPEETLAEHGIR